MLAQPVAIAAVIALLAGTLLLGGRSLAPFVFAEGASNPAWFSMRSPQQATEERELQAEVDRLLASFASSSPRELP